MNFRDLLRVVQAKGAGLAVSQQQELETIRHVAQATGVICNCQTVQAEHFGLVTVYMVLDAQC